jgi:hypothetical protein
MVNSGGDRSVKARDITGSQVITGDSNRAVMRGVKVTLPPPGDVQPERELAELRVLLSAFETPEKGKLDRALQDAEEEAKKPEPDKDEIGSALERAIRYAKSASDFGEQAEKLARPLGALASWLGANWHKLVALAGLAI